ncbi:MAG: hypothetical protein ACYDA1_06070 [Vulcanimicrobiaceae bacterium]
MMTAVMDLHGAMLLGFSRVDRLETRIDSIETKIDSIETKIGSIEAKTTSIEAEVRGLQRWRVETDQRLDLAGIARATP